MLKPVPFGKYYLLERINVGGMAEVFKAKAFGVEGFERLFAVKKILPQIAADEEFIRMFVDEAKIAVQLSHANIAQIFDLGKVDGTYFISLEYVSGKDLRTIFEQANKQNRPWSVPQVCYVVMQVCEGLDYAHNKRDSSGAELHLVHRDISPQNILLSYEGELKIIDFGIAKAAGRASKTQAGILKGKFGYMSPEQVRGLPLDRRSDIFSLGIIVYEFLTNERLFSAESDFSILEKIRNVEIPPLRSKNPAIPIELEEIVMRTLARNPEERFQTAAELHDQLQKFMFASGLFYTRKDLAAYMREVFSADLDREQAALDEYRRFSPLPGSLGRPDLPPPPSSSNSLFTPPVNPGGWSLPPQPPLARPISPVDRGAQPITATSSHPVWTSQPQNGSGTTGIKGSIGSMGSLRADGLASLSSNPNILVSAHSSEVLMNPMDFSAASSSLPVQSASPSLGGSSTGLEWDDDEETSVYDKQVPAAAAHAESGDVDDLSEADIVYAEQRPDRLLPHPPLPEGLSPVGPAPARGRRGSRIGFFVGFTFLALLGAVVVTYVFLSLKGRDASLELRTVPADQLIVSIDEKEIHRGASPITIRRLEPGPHKLTVRREGYLDETQQVTLARDRATSLTMNLRPASDKGAIRLVTIPPGASIRIDGQLWQGKTPQLVDGLSFGQHQVVLSLSGHEVWSQPVNIEPGTPAVRSVTLKPATADLAVRSKPDGMRFSLRVLPDGETRTGKTPEVVKGLPAGAEVEVTLEEKGYLHWKQTHQLQGSGQENILEAVLMPLEGMRPEPAGSAAVRPPTSPPVARPPREITTRPPTPPPTPVVVPEPSQPTGVTPSPPVEVKPGTLKIMAIPYARVFVDGTDIGDTPITNYQLSSGKHRVTLINNEFAGRMTFEVEIQPGKVNFVKKVNWINP